MWRVYVISVCVLYSYATTEQYRDSILIVFRYFAKELFNVWLAISGILLLIIVSGRFIKYLEQAAIGRIKAEFLFAIMGYRLFGFLEMLMPLALFIGILLAYGRLYVDSEMTVLETCGMSQHRLLGYTMVPALLVAVLVGLCSIWLTPMGTAQVENILVRQDMTELNDLAPGRFQRLSGGDHTLYVESFVNDKSLMNYVFIAQQTENGTGNDVALLLAEKGSMHFDKKSNKRYLMLSNGYRYNLVPGKPQIRIMQYETYGVQMHERAVSEGASKASMLPTSVLLSDGSNVSKAEWQWRISLPLLVPVIVLMALPLARVNPRQGRFMKLLPGILLYLLYIALLIAARGAVEDGKLSPAIGVWCVHGVFFVVALVMFYWRPLNQMLHDWRRSAS